MDEWNPLLAPPAGSAARSRLSLKDKVTAGILAFLFALGLIGWLLSL